MTTTAAPPAASPEGAAGAPDALTGLTGPSAREVLAHALAPTGEAPLDHEVHLVEARPGDGLTVGYRVWVRRPGGEVAEDYLLVSSSAGRDVPAEAPGLVRLDGPLGPLLAWRHPGDPALPGLAAACTPDALEGVLPGAGPVTDLELVGYRPLRRAVLRAERAGRTWWVKVLRPAAGRGGAPDVLHRHRLLRDAGLPVPEVLTATPGGLLVLGHLEGTPLATAIGDDDADGLEVTHLTGLLDALPAGVTDLPRRAAWSDRARAYGTALTHLPHLAARAEAVGREVRRRSRRVDLGPVVPTHGDFHDGQLVVARRGGRSAGHWAVRGLLDVDTVGPGHRVDDLACLVAHALALGPRGAATAARWEHDAAALVDPAALAVRTAGVLLSLAAGAAHGAGPTASGTLLEAAEHQLCR